MKYILSLILLIIIAIFISYNSSENFADIKQLENDTNKLKHLDLVDFNVMIANIQKIIYDGLFKATQTCSKMNGENIHIDALQNNQLTLTCINDLNALNESITNDITKYIMDSIKDKCNINLNYFSVYFDVLNNLDLYNNVIDPLVNSEMYTDKSRNITANGISYFTKTKLQNAVITNLYIRDILYTILQRRGIDTLSNVSRNY